MSAVTEFLHELARQYALMFAARESKNTHRVQHPDSVREVDHLTKVLGELSPIQGLWHRALRDAELAKVGRPTLVRLLVSARHTYLNVRQCYRDRAWQDLELELVSFREAFEQVNDWLPAAEQVVFPANGVLSKGAIGKMGRPLKKRGRQHVRRGFDRLVENHWDPKVYKSARDFWNRNELFKHLLEHSKNPVGRIQEALRRIRSLKSIQQKRASKKPRVSKRAVNK